MSNNLLYNPKRVVDGKRDMKGKISWNTPNKRKVEENLLEGDTSYSVAGVNKNTQGQSFRDLSSLNVTQFYSLFMFECLPHFLTYVSSLSLTASSSLQLQVTMVPPALALPHTMSLHNILAPELPCHLHSMSSQLTYRKTGNYIGLFTFICAK